MMDGYWPAIIGFLAFYLLSAKFWKSQRKAVMINEIPGPKLYPILGNIPMFLVPPEEILPTITQIHNNYGDIFRTWLGFRPQVHLVAPEYIEIILSATKHNRKGRTYRFLAPWLGNGLLTNSGQIWFTHRKLISPTFHFKVLHSFIEVFNECSQALVKKLSEKADGRYFDICPFLNRCTLDIICETAMGARIQAHENETSSFVAATIKASRLISERQFTGYLHPDFIYYKTKQGKEFKRVIKILHDFTDKVIQERKILRNEIRKSEEDNFDDGFGEKKRLAFLDLLIKASDGDENPLSDLELREEVTTFMFAGHDTTNTSLAWTLLLLGNHPEIQDAVREELNNVLQEDDRPVNLKDLGKLKLMERVIKESMRLFPAVSMITRLNDNELKMGKHVIPADTDIVIHIFSMHRHPSLYPDPLKFDPDRFLPENCIKRHPYSYIPFSAGQRNCLGQKFAIMEEKIVLATLLRKFKIRSLHQPSDISMITDIVVRPKGSIMIQLEPIIKQ